MLSLAPVPAVAAEAAASICPKIIYPQKKQISYQVEAWKAQFELEILFSL